MTITLFMHQRRVKSLLIRNPGGVLFDMPLFFTGLSSKCELPICLMVGTHLTEPIILPLYGPLRSRKTVYKEGHGG